MKKYIFILNAIELLKLLLDGKYVQGVLYMDQNTGRITFKAYNRQPRTREKDVLVKKLPWGWGKGVGGAHQGVWQFPQGCRYGPGDGTVGGQHP